MWVDPEKFTGVAGPWNYYCVKRKKNRSVDRGSVYCGSLKMHTIPSLLVKEINFE